MGPDPSGMLIRELQRHTNLVSVRARAACCHPCGMHALPPSLLFAFFVQLTLMHCTDEILMCSLVQSVRQHNAEQSPIMVRSHFPSDFPLTILLTLSVSLMLLRSCEWCTKWTR